MCAGAGAYLGRRAREGEAAINSQTIGQLLAGFFQFYAPVLGDWAQGCNSSWRASTWWGDWKEAGWPGGKNYIFCIEDPFNAGKRGVFNLESDVPSSCGLDFLLVQWGLGLAEGQK